MKTGLHSSDEEEIQVTDQVIRDAQRPCTALREAPALAKVPNALPLPADARRGGGWAKYSDRVVVVRYVDGEVSILAGHICSTPGSHLCVDNISRVVVWFDEPYRLADDADDAHERAFDVTDPNLFLAYEICLVQYPALAKLWFGNMYSDLVLDQIRTAVTPFALAQRETRAFGDLLCV